MSKTRTQSSSTATTALENIWFFDKKWKAQACVHKKFEGEINYSSQGAFRLETSNQKASHSVTSDASGGWKLMIMLLRKLRPRTHVAKYPGHYGLQTHQHHPPSHCTHPHHHEVLWEVLPELCTMVISCLNINLYDCYILQESPEFPCSVTLTIFFKDNN